MVCRVGAAAQPDSVRSPRTRTPGGGAHSAAASGRVHRGQVPGGVSSPFCLPLIAVVGGWQTVRFCSEPAGRGPEPLLSS